jgi:hypothetical protein
MWPRFTYVLVENRFSSVVSNASIHVGDQHHSPNVYQMVGGLAGRPQKPFDVEAAADLYYLE